LNCHCHDSKELDSNALILFHLSCHLLGIQGWIPSKRLTPIQEFLKENLAEDKLQQRIPLPPPPTSIPIKKSAPMPNKLDMTKKELETNIQKELSNNDNFPPELPMMKESIGMSDLMYPRTFLSFHNATPLLLQYAQNGCPVDCGPDWDKNKILLLMKRGPYKSSTKKEAVQQLQSETLEKIEMGYARVISWKDIKDNIPKKLKISPVAMIPHKSKKYRCILDLSFTLFHEGHEYSSFNETTNKQAKLEAMAQLGLCLQRIVTIMADNMNPQKPFIFSKLDIKDGFWQMRVSDEDAWNFCYVLPSLKQTKSIDDTKLVVPNSLQMGWCESPPIFLFRFRNSKGHHR
jgi:hypothetical protein